MLEGFDSVPINEFRGLMILPNRTKVQPKFSVAAKNCAFTPGGVKMRPGTSQRISLGGGTDTYRMEIMLASSRYHLLLMNGPSLYYSKDYAARTLLKSGITSARHFRREAFGEFAFFCFSDSNLGVIEPYVWSSIGSSDYFDPATEAAPTVGSFAAADSGTAGSVTAGAHSLVVIYETRSGYQTSPSAAISFTASGTKKVALTAIPTGGSTISKRHIGMTAAGGATYYLLATINDNTDTAEDYDITDAQLIQQTELTDWFQFKDPLPNVSGCVLFHERMVYWGDAANASYLWISEKGLPATVRSDVGFRAVRKGDGDRITNCVVLGDTLFVFKSRAIYAITDNGDDPFNWPEERVVCSWAGTVSPSGIATSTDKQEVFFLDVKGIYRFNGGDPVLISTPIQPYFDEYSDQVSPVNYSYISRGEMLFDPEKRRIFAFIPTGSSQVPDTVLVGDVREGMDRVKWCPWVTAGTAWRSIAVDSVEVNIAEAGAYVSKFDDDEITERDGTGIDAYSETGVIEGKRPQVHLLGGATIDATGSGTLAIGIYDSDGALIASPTGLTLSAAPGRDLFRRMNKRSERFFIRVGTNDPAATFELTGITAYIKPDGVRVL